MTTFKTIVRTALVVLALGGLTAGTFATLQPTSTTFAGSTKDIVDVGGGRLQGRRPGAPRRESRGSGARDRAGAFHLMPDLPQPHEPPPLDALRFLYQPVEALSSLDDGWHEALVRWYLEDGTVRGPDTVLPYWLEPTRQSTFTRFTVQHAAEALQAHPEARLSVNLSPRQATHPTALCALEDVLPELRGRLIVELTEQRYLDIGGLWASLAALGERLDLVLLDDVSAPDLERRWQLDAPVDGIKLDRTVLALLRDRDTRPRVAKLVREASLRFRIVVVEGVEAEHDLDLLEGIGATHAQGFGIGRPGRALAPDDLRGRGRAEAVERPIRPDVVARPGVRHDHDR